MVEDEDERAKSGGGFGRRTEPLPIAPGPLFGDGGNSRFADRKLRAADVLAALRRAMTGSPALWLLAIAGAALLYYVVVFTGYRYYFGRSGREPAQLVVFCLVLAATACFVNSVVSKYPNSIADIAWRAADRWLLGIWLALYLSQWLWFALDRYLDPFGDHSYLFRIDYAWRFSIKGLVLTSIFGAVMMLHFGSRKLTRVGAILAPAILCAWVYVDYYRVMKTGTMLDHVVTIMPHSDPREFRHPYCRRWSNGATTCERSRLGKLTCVTEASKAGTPAAWVYCMPVEVPYWCAIWSAGCGLQTRTGLFSELASLSEHSFCDEITAGKNDRSGVEVHRPKHTGCARTILGEYTSIQEMPR